MESRKRSLDEGSSLCQPSPEVKRPRVQYPIGVTPAEVAYPGPWLRPLCSGDRVQLHPGPAPGPAPTVSAATRSAAPLAQAHRPPAG